MDSATKAIHTFDELMRNRKAASKNAYTAGKNLD
jgi:hypothetical protein